MEDAVTRDYLGKLWAGTPDVAFLIAGTNIAIPPVIGAAEREGISHVFGLVDRDFGTTNRANWHLPQTRTFRLPRHEIENYLLDPAAVAGCVLNNRGRVEAEVQAEIARLAGLQPCWLACRRVLREAREAMQASYPGHPPLNAITTLAQAQAHIESSA